MAKYTDRTNFCISKELEEEIDRMAEEIGASRSYVIRLLIRKGLLSPDILIIRESAKMSKESSDD